MRLIDADKFKERMILKFHCVPEIGVIPYQGEPRTVYLTEAIESEPVIDTQPVVHAHWKEEVFFNGCTPDIDISCSLCGHRTGDFNFDFCPWCGAKMDEVIK